MQQCVTQTITMHSTAQTKLMKSFCCHKVSWHNTSTRIFMQQVSGYNTSS